MIAFEKLRFLKCAVLPAALLGLAGCATNGGTAASSGGTGGGSTTTTTTFTASDLKGTYVFSVTGSNTDDGNYAVVGSFTADGNGKITSGEEDYNAGSGVDSAVLLTGTYAVNSTGTALLALTDGVSVQDSMTVTLVKSGPSMITGYGLNGTGTLTPSTVTGFTAPGTYTYTVAGIGQGTVTGSGTASVGSNLTISGGTQTYTDNGRTISLTANTGFIGTPNSLGRAYASIGGHTYALYPITTTSFALIGIDENALLTGTGTKA